MYLLSEVIPRQLAEFERISPQPASNQMIQQALKNPQLADQFVQEYMKDHKNLKIFGQELAQGHDTLRTYETQLQRQLKEQLRDYDLTGDILAENAYLIPQYKKRFSSWRKKKFSGVVSTTIIWLCCLRRKRRILKWCRRVLRK